MDEIELREIEAYLVDGERWMTVEAMDYGESSIVALIAEVRRLRGELEEAQNEIATWRRVPRPGAGGIGGAF